MDSKHYGGFLIAAGLLFSIFLLAGCSSVFSPNKAKSRRALEQQELSEPYEQITLVNSLTLDAIPKIKRSQGKAGSLPAETETVSHSDRVVASLGQSRGGYSTWFNMVTFHEFRLNVIRKYFFAVEDKAGGLFTGARRGLRFDCQMVLGKEVLEKSYASENERRIAVLRYVRNAVHEDIQELGGDVDVPGQYNKKLDVCGMLINQTLELILVKLDSSPVLAEKLNGAGGLDLEHINFGRGAVHMVVSHDIVALKARFGAWRRQNESLDEQ